jgi:hypothetical protein
LVLSGVSFAPVAARADAVDDLVAKGEDHAKKSEYSLAIEAFKQADHERPRAKHACMIALAYTRRELWPQAEIFFDLCHQRATATDPLPTWIGAAEKQLADKLAQVTIAAVTVVVTPADAGAKVAVSSFAPDETFAPRVIHLAPGRHNVEVAAPGFVTQTREVVVVGRTPQTVAFELARPATVTTPTEPIHEPVIVVPPTTGGGTPVIKPPAPAASASRVPTYVLYAGGALAVVGIGFHLDLGYEHGKLASAKTMDEYTSHSAQFDHAKTATIVCYGAAALTLAVGAILKYTVYKEHEPAVAVGVTPIASGGVLTFAWSR